MRILVADDDRTIVHLVATLLRKQSHHVVAAFDAMQVFMFAMQNPALDAVILDLNMPGGKGVDVVRRLKSSLKTALIPVIVLSGAIEPDVVSEMKGVGAHAFLAKPLDVGLLFATLDALKAKTGGVAARN